MYQIITLFALAALAMAAPDARERRYAGQNNNLNVQSSSVFSGPYGGGGPGSGSAALGGASAGASASASSYAGSSSYSGDGGNGGGSYSGTSGGGSPGGYGQGASNAGSTSGSYGQGSSNGGSPSGSYGQGSSNGGSPSGSYGQGPSNGYGDKGPADNAIPTSNTPGSANYASSYPGSGSGYAGGFSNSYGSGGGFQDSGFTPGQNLPPGCFSGFPGAGFDPFRIHQEIMNQIQRQHEENLRFGAGIAAQAGQRGGPHTIANAHHTGNAHPWTAINQAASASNQQLANFLRTFPSKAPAVVPFSVPRVVPINTWHSNPKNPQQYTSYQSAFASGHVGPGGGYGAAGVSPKDPGSSATRFGDPVPNGPVHSISGNIPPPSGTTYGISTSSHSVTDTVNGVPKTYKESSVTVNDNGKVTSYKSHSP